MTIFSVAIGGAVGAVTRFLVHRGMTLWHGADAAWSTLAVNVSGSFVLGAVAAALMERPSLLPGAWAPAVTIGLLGAFTTFSTFALDAVTLFKDRGLGVAALYAGLS
ncbi:MAG: CrcB family protein, partial [Pseudomonadota bacterium]